MLTSLRLRDIRNWKDTGRVALAPVTVFVGPDSAAKIGIVENLLMLRQSARSPDSGKVLETSGPLVDLGTFDDLLPEGGRAASMVFELGWSDDESLEVVDLLPVPPRRVASHRLGIEVAIGSIDGAPAVAELTYLVGDTRYTMRRDPGGRGYALHSDDFAFVRKITLAAAPLPPPVRFYGFPPETRAAYASAPFLPDLERRFEERLLRFHHVGPHRADPRRRYADPGGMPDGVGRRGEHAVGILIAARRTGRRASRGGQPNGVRLQSHPAIELDRLVEVWLRDLGLADTFELTEVDPGEGSFEVRVRAPGRSASVLLADAGPAVNQVVPVLVTLACARRDDAVLLEQPEAHLRPAAQPGLADVIIETALARGAQVIVETGSEHVLTRLRERLAEVDLARGVRLDASSVAVYVCDRHQAEGSNRLSRLGIDDHGGAAAWPRDLSTQRLRDRMAS